MGSGDAEFPSGWKTSYPCKIFIVVADVLRPDILPQLKHVGFSLLLRFSSSSLTVMTVLREPITEFWRLSSSESCASVGISAPHACIPVCMQSGYTFCPFLCQDCGTETFPTSCRRPSGQIIAWGIFMHDFLMISQEQFHA